MKFNKLIPELTVKNIEKTKKFYLDILGFKMEYGREENKFVFLSFEGFLKGESVFRLLPYGQKQYTAPLVELLPSNHPSGSIPFESSLGTPTLSAC